MLSCQGSSSKFCPLHRPLVCFKQLMKSTVSCAFASSNTIRFHSFFASSSRQEGQRGAFFCGFGSLPLRHLFPGFPSSTFTAVGFGFLPHCATAFTSSLQNLYFLLKIKFLFGCQSALSCLSISPIHLFHPPGSPAGTLPPHMPRLPFCRFSIHSGVSTACASSTPELLALWLINPPL